MLQCYNRGCGETFDPAKNTAESCRHHPGEPFFHDAYKGWSCCQKKSADFTEFLNIKGCTLSKHSNVKPPAPENSNKTNNIKTDEIKITHIRKPISVALERPPVDTSMTAVHATVAPALKAAIDKLSGGTKSTEECDLATGEVLVGTACQNSGCTYSYSGTSSDKSECQYHPGVPVFHEGLKFWSCCQKRTTDFDVFMSQKGCTSGEHKWFKEREDKKVAKCRYDWHQTSKEVIVSIYAKMYHYTQSIIEVNPVRLHVNLVFPEQENARFDLDLELRGIIDPTKVTANMYGSKVEIKMPKGEAGSWSKLDFPNSNLPPPKSINTPSINNTNHDHSDSDDDINLDDIDTVTNGFRLTEFASKNDVD